MSRARPSNAPKVNPAPEAVPDPRTGLVPDPAAGGTRQAGKAPEGKVISKASSKAISSAGERSPRGRGRTRGRVRDSAGPEAGADEATAPLTAEELADGKGGRDAKTLILDTAERLFGQRGLGDVSVREITSAAGVNVALVAYYFGSRDGLVRAVLDRLSIDLNRKRYAMLNAFKASGPVGVREILEAYFAPALMWLDPEGPRRSAGEVVTRLFVDAPPEIRAKLELYVRHHRVFVEELRAVLPQLSFEDACWAFHFARGVLQGNTDLQLLRLRNVSEGLCDISDIDGVLRRTVDFAACAIETWAKRGPPSV